MKNFRPYTIYKAFGAVLTVLSLPNVIGYFIWGTPTTPKPSLTTFVGSVLFGIVGVWIFVSNDRYIKVLSASNNNPKPGIDFRGIVVFASALLLFLFFVAVRARQGG